MSSPYESYESGEFESPDAGTVRAVLEECGWTQEKAAQLVGVGARTFRRYVSDGDTVMGYAEWQLLLYHANYDIGKRTVLVSTDD